MPPAVSVSVRALAAALIALAAAGCQSLGFAIANAGAPAPEASVVYDRGRNLALDVHRPPGPASRPAPVVVFLHGGSWRRGERAQYRFVGRRLAQAGILAIVADYRTFPRAVFPGFVEDAAGAVAWARRHAAAHGGDPRRLYVAGHSAGAQIAALIGADARYLARHGMTPRDLAGVIGLSGPYDFDVAGHEAVFGPPAQWPQAQPVAFVDGDEPPFLLVHGTRDQVVQAGNSRDMAGRLRAAGIRTELLWLDDAGHLAPLVALYRPRRHPALMAAIRDFVGSGGAAPGSAGTPSPSPR